MDWQSLMMQIGHLTEALKEKRCRQAHVKEAKAPWLGWDGWVNY